MKKIFLFAALGLFALNSSAQKTKVVKESEVTPTILQSFKKLYPNVTVTKWEMGPNAINWEAEYKEGGVEHSVLLGPNGQFMESEMEIKVSELPKAVSDYCSKNLAGKKIAEASKITDAKGKVTYEAEVDETDYIIDENGTLISKESEDGEDKDDKK